MTKNRTFKYSPGLSRRANVANLRKERVRESIYESYRTLLRQKNAYKVQLDNYYTALLESNSTARKMEEMALAINKKLENPSLLESSTYNTIKDAEATLESKMDSFVEKLLESDDEFASLRKKFDDLKEQIVELKKAASKAGIKDLDMTKLDMNEDDEDDDTEDDSQPELDFSALDSEDDKSDDEDEEKDEDEDKSDDEDEETTDDSESDEEITLASIIIEVTDVDAVIEELKEYKIPEDAIKIVEKDEDEDEGKIKIDADYITELGEYCKTKGWDLEEALGGTIVKDDKDGDDDSDMDSDEKQASDELASLGPDDITDEDLFGPEDTEDEKDSDEKEDKE